MTHVLLGDVPPPSLGAKRPSTTTAISVSSWQRPLLPPSLLSRRATRGADLRPDTFLNVLLKGQGDLNM